ncbi:alpha/beta fold hydrolase [Candidatus Bipolaricaulota bacterium]
MPLAINEGVRIHYRIEGSGPSLVLHHWTFADLEWWSEFGYVEALKDSATLILIDSRAHGNSDKPADPEAYDLETRVRDVTCVLDAVGASRAHFLGFSMGGWIGYGMAIHAPQRLCSLTIGGAHPYEQSMEGARNFLRIGEEQGAQAFVEAWESGVAPLTSAQRARMLAFDFSAMIAAANDRASLEEPTSHVEIPSTLFVGEDDSIRTQVARAANMISSAELITLPGKDHGASIREYEHVLPLVRSMLESHPC